MEIIDITTDLVAPIKIRGHIYKPMAFHKLEGIEQDERLVLKGKFYFYSWENNDEIGLSGEMWFELDEEGSWTFGESQYRLIDIFVNDPEEEEEEKKAVTIMLPVILIEQIKELAKKEKRKISGMIELLLEKALRGE